jgi:lipoprotein NlpI/transglutaminase-like putative cysteine protease
MVPASTGRARAAARAAALAFTVLVAAAPQAATRPARPAATKASAAAAPRVPADAGYAIGPRPAWVQPVAVDAAAPAAAAPVQVLLADRQVRVEGASLTRYLHFARRVGDAAGLSQLGQVQIEFDPAYQKLVLHRIEIVRDGRRIDKLDPRAIRVLHRETQLERQVIDGRKTLSLVLDDLRVGDVVEWEASEVGANPVFGGRFVDTEGLVEGDGPIAHYRYRLLAPASRALALHSDAAGLPVTQAVHGDERETVVERRDVPRFASEPGAPPSEWLKDAFDVSEFASWHDVAAWAVPLFAKATQASPAVDAEVERLRAAGATPAERAAAALDFVQGEVRYFGTEVGMGTHQPAPADTVLRQRFGDCKDKVSLLVTLLRRLDIDAVPVLVSMGLRDATAQRTPTPLAFDHVIVRAILDGRPLFLDATRHPQRGSLGSREARGFGSGLVVADDTTALAPLPAERDVLRAEIVDTLSFPRLAEPGTLESVGTFHGDLADFIRAAAAASPQDKFDQGMQEQVLRSFEHLEPQGHAVVAEVPGEDALRVTTRYRVPQAWSFADTRTLAMSFRMVAVAAPLAHPDAPVRQQPFRFAQPGRYAYTLRLEFGEPLGVTPRGDRFDDDAPQYGLHIRYEGDPHAEQVVADLQVDDAPVAPADWPALRDRLARLAPRLGGGLRIPPLGPDDVAALRTESQALAKQLSSRRVKPGMARIEAEARMQALFLDKALAAGRLPPKPRAQALLAKGAGLDRLGQPDAARAAFEEALRLDPDDAGVHEAAAANALFRGDDAQAIAQAEAALKLAPSQPEPRYTRAWAQWFEGHPDAARDDLLALLRSRTEVERSYGAIWLYLATRRLGGDAQAAVAPYLPTSSRPAWPWPALQLMLGRTSLHDAQVQAEAEGPETGAQRDCELWFFAGEKALADGDRARARRLFEDSLDTGVVAFNEYQMARRELDALGR